MTESNTRLDPPKAFGGGFSSTSEALLERISDEIPFTLTRMEYQVLRAGESTESRAGRDLCLGFLGSALIGLVALITEVNWETAFRQARLAPFIWAAVLFAFVLSSACGAVIYQRHYTRNNRAHDALMWRLTQFFEDQDPSSLK
jgi:hypothetical protein